MKIAITDLKDYVEGILRFEWLDLEGCSSKEEIGGFIKDFLDKRSRDTGELHEEWFVSDYEAFVNLGEYPNIEDIEAGARLSSEYGWDAVARYYENVQSFDDFEEAYQGEWKSEEDFAYELAQDIYSEKQLGVLSNYIDWERFARDLFVGDYTSEKLHNCGIVVFRNL